MLDNNNVLPSYCVKPSFASGFQSNQRDSAPAFHVSTGASREPQTLSRELRAMGYRKLSARPRHHAQAEGAIEDFKKTSRPSGRDRAREKKVDPGAIEIWLADEARIGQKNKITWRCARHVQCAAASRAVTTEIPHK
jgi:hypothetical protein